MKKSFAKLSSKKEGTPSYSEGKLSQYTSKETPPPNNEGYSIQKQPKRGQKRLPLGKAAVPNPVFSGDV